MKSVTTWFIALEIILLGGITTTNAEGWKRALPGWRYVFPRDHGNHPDFKTEWWYFTGRLQDEKGREFGYELTFFRHGIRPPERREQVNSRFVLDHLQFAHFAISDTENEKFLFAEKLSRGAFGEAGFRDSTNEIWIDDYYLAIGDATSIALRAEEKDFSIDLHLIPSKPPVIHGIDGVDQKAAGIGNASHYYSFTRLKTDGKIVVDGKPRAVRGESWFDHEWATNQLAENQVGWNWFSIQFDDGSELMLYQLRMRDGSADPNSSGTFVSYDGEITHIASDEFTLTPTSFYTSAESKARYPVSWQIEVPSQAIALEVTTPLEKQELVWESLAYWEGLIHVKGTRRGLPITGHGYMELTGYAGPLAALRSRSASSDITKTLENVWEQLFLSRHDTVQLPQPRTSRRIAHCLTHLAVSCHQK